MDTSDSEDVLHIGGIELTSRLFVGTGYLPRVGLTLSTRESPTLREYLLPLGITRMSAGSLTSVGGYAEDTQPGSAQFEIADERPCAEIVKMLHSKGYQTVFCDWVNTREQEHIEPVSKTAGQVRG